MNLVDLLKKNIVMVPVVASVLVGTFTGVRYIVNLTDTINSNQLAITNLQRDLEVAEKILQILIQDYLLLKQRGRWQKIYTDNLADQVREHDYDIKDLNREINY